MDKRYSPLEFEVGDRVFLKVASWKHIIRFGMKGKLAPRYICPFEIVQMIGHVAYRLSLPPHILNIHVILHVSLLQKAGIDPICVSPQVLLEINEDFTLEVHLIYILDRSEKKLQNKRIPKGKIFWKSSQIEEVMWERESEIKKKHLKLFSDTHMN